MNVLKGRTVDRAEERGTSDEGKGRPEAPRAHRTSTAPRSLRRRLRRAPLWLAVTIICVVCVFPFFWMLLTSLKPNSDIFTATPKFYTTTPVLSRYSALWSTGFPHNFLNSLIVATGTTVVGTAIAAAAGYTLARFRIPMRRYLLVVVLMVQLIPQVVLVIPLFIIMRSAGLLNSYPGLILCYLPLTISLGIWMMRSFFLTIPPELEEAAMVDGASRLGAFYRIALPLAWPGLSASAIYAFITSWNELMFALTIMQNSSMQTLPVALNEFFATYYNNWGGVMAASVIFSAPVIGFFLLVQRRLVRGMVVGAIKG
jgi:N,N'-diacetylchitobiose transport system permease protein